MGINTPKRTGIFGGGSTPWVIEERQPYPPAAAPTAAPEQKPKVNWAGVLADALSGFAGGPAHFANRQYEQRQLEARSHAQAQRDAAQRAAGMEDWVWKQKYEANNPKPSEWDDNAGNRWRNGPRGPEMVFHDANAKRIPQKVTNPDGSESIEWIEIPNAYNPDGTPRQQQSAVAPQAPVGKLKPYGGPTAPQSGGFR